MLRVWLCGRIAAEFDGVPLAMPSSERARALFGWLALNPGATPRADVAARLWPDAPDAHARASLRTAIWALRQAWGPAADPVLVGTRHSLGIITDMLWVDATSDDGPVPPGVLLPGVDDDWAIQARVEHHQRCVRRLDGLAVVAEQEGRSADAVAYARERCLLTPLDEAAHRDLMVRLEAAGDRAGALVVAREFAARLRAELGVKPSPATRAVEADLRSPHHAQARPTLFGRAGELRAVTAAWRAAAKGAGQVVVLTGEAGIGKTSLLTEVCHRVTASGARTAVGSGSDVGGETPYAACLEVVQALVAEVDPVPDSVPWPAELNRLSPGLGVRLGRPDPPPGTGPPELERLRLFEAVLRLVEWACADRPVLLAVDDIHRADRASLRLLDYLGRRLGRLPLLLVLVRRDRPRRAEVDTLVAALAARGVVVTDIELGPLADRDMAALTSSVLHLDDDALRRLIAAAEGNPLLGFESVRALAAGAGTPPPNLRTAVRGALGALSPDARALVQLLAVAGHPLAPEELDRLGSDVSAAESAGLESGLLAHRSGRLGFRHVLLRELVYGDLADPGVLHEQIARILDRADHAELARHLGAAGRPTAAAQEWAAAAQYARSVGALAEASDCLIHACECAPAQASLWLDLAEVLAWQGRRPAMQEAWDRALALLPSDALAPAWVRRGRQFRSVICHPQESLTAYRQAQSLLGEDASGALRAEVLIGLAWGQSVAGDPDVAEGLLATAERLFEDPPGDDVRRDIAEIRILGLTRRGRFAECQEVAYALTAKALEPLPPTAYTLWMNVAGALACTGDFEGALALADRAVALTESVPVLLVECLAGRAMLLARLGRHAEAAAATEREQACAERLDSPTISATVAHDAGMVALMGGRYPAAVEALTAALAGEPAASRSAARLALAEALVRTGDVEGAASQVRAAALEPVRPADRAWALTPRMAGVQAMIAATRGDTEVARRRFDEAVDGWRSLLGEVAPTQTEGYFSGLVDLGRTPVLGLVEPARELALIEQERAALTPHARLPRTHANL